MAEIRNLTRNGETFYPLTTMSAVINEATGEGLVIDDEPTPGSDNLAKSGGTYSFIKANTLEEKEHLSFDNEVAGYLTDKNKSIIAKLMKSGAVEWLVENSKDIANNARFEDIEDILSYVSSEVPDNGSGVIKYLTDKDGVVIATINNVGDAEFKGGGGFDGEVTKSRNINFDAVKVLTDNKNTIIGWITKGGKVHIIELEAEHLSVDDNSDVGIPNQLFPMLGFIANGTHMRQFVNDKAYNLLFNMEKGKYKKEGSPISLEPTLLIHDDDTVDYQLPTSSNRNATDETQPTTTIHGGYASILLPIIMAINAKHSGEINAENGKVTIGLAAEGQRIGLTPLYGHEDTFNNQLNNNGKIAKKIAEHEGWDILCHSMTARYIAENYIVDGLDSSFAQVVLQNSNWSGDLVWGTTTCYNVADGKNYQIKEDKSGWDALPAHYIKPYCAFSIEVAGNVIVNTDYQDEYDSGKRLIINPTYSVKYQVNTWFERAEKSGLPYIDRAGINWGSSHSVWHMKESLKYSDFFFGRHGETNIVPIDTNAIRFSYNPSASRNGVSNVSHYNVYTEKEYDRLIHAIDSCIENKSLTILYGHTNEYTQHYNYYFQDLTYPTERTGDRLNYKDDLYPESWIVPLKWVHLQDMLNDPNSEYWIIPPLMRRNQDGTLSDVRMESWSEYYPCPGTTEAMLYDIIEYAISKGVRFATSEEAIKMFGSMFNLGIKVSYGDQWTADSELGNIIEENRSYCQIGADGTIDCSLV